MDDAKGAIDAKGPISARRPEIKPGDRLMAEWGNWLGEAVADNNDRLRRIEEKLDRLLAEKGAGDQT